MKIGQVCEKTGLSERTIRYYCEEDLITPESYTVSGRTYRDYSREDVKTLTDIAALRRALFTIDEIKKMLQSPGEIQTVLAGYHNRIAAETRERVEILNAIRELDLSRVDSVSALTKQMESVSRRMALPPRDVNPDFSKFDTESREEKDAEYAAYQEREAASWLWGQRIVIAIAALNAIFAIISNLFLSFNLFNLIWQLLLSGLLFMGMNWVRWLFIIGGFFSIVLNFVLVIPLLMDPGVMTELQATLPLLLPFYVVSIVFQLVSTGLLLFHKGVKDFLYQQKNG